MADCDRPESTLGWTPRRENYFIALLPPSKAAPGETSSEGRPRGDFEIGHIQLDTNAGTVGSIACPEAFVVRRASEAGHSDFVAALLNHV